MSFGSKWEILIKIIFDLNLFSFDNFEKNHENISKFALYYRLLKCGLPDNGTSSFAGFDPSHVTQFSAALSTMAEKWETASSTGESLKNLLRLQKATNSSDELEQLEQLMRSVSRDQNTRDNFRLHSHFRLVYSVFNGQSYNTESTNLSTSPLFGLIQVYGKLILPFLMPLNLIRQNIHNQRGRASEIFSTVGMIPLVINPYSDSFIWYFDNSTGRILCPRLDLVSDDYSGYYVVADDIFRLLELAGRLITATADRIDQNEEMYFISGFTNPVNKRTDSYNIVVRTAFLFGESAVTPPQYHYAYEIIQSMDKDGPFYFNFYFFKLYFQLQRTNR